LSANGFRFNNKKSLTGFLTFFQKMKKGDTLKLEVLRAGEVISAEWKLK